MTRLAVSTVQTEGLLARVKAATGPDRELSCSIAKALGWKPDPGMPGADTSAPWAWCPDFTASIDAALALVERVLPEANCYGVEKDPLGWTAYVSRNNVSSGHWMKEAEHKTAPLAILAALLKAEGQTP